MVRKVSLPNPLTVSNCEIGSTKGNAFIFAGRNPSGCSLLAVWLCLQPPVVAVVAVVDGIACVAGVVAGVASVVAGVAGTALVVLRACLAAVAVLPPPAAPLASISAIRSRARLR